MHEMREISLLSRDLTTFLQLPEKKKVLALLIMGPKVSTDSEE